MCDHIRKTMYEKGFMNWTVLLHSKHSQNFFRKFQNKNTIFLNNNVYKVNYINDVLHIQLQALDTFLSNLLHVV